MSAQTNVYIYNQRKYVVLLQSTARSTVRYEEVYAKTLTINRGVDNLLEFAFINQEQKPVNISGKEITCRILDYTGTTVLIKKALTPKFPVTGISELYLSREELENIETQYCYYSLEIPVGAFDFPVFVDADGGARGKINIVNSVLPSFVAAEPVNIPSHVPPTPNANVSNISYFSSIINTVNSPTMTIQGKLTEFTGNITVLGSTLQDFSIFYPISGPYEYSAGNTFTNVYISSDCGTFTCGNTVIKAGQSVTVSGTPSGTGAITGYSSGTVYYITSTNGVNQFTLSDTQNGTPVNTVVGTTDGMDFIINGYTGSVIYNVAGYHPWVRLLVVNVGTNPITVGNVSALSGDISNVYARVARPAT